MATLPAWGGTIPLVKWGSLGEWRELKNYEKNLAYLITGGKGLVLRRGVIMFLTTRTGLALLAALGLSGVAAPAVDNEQLMRDIQQWLKEQHKVGFARPLKKPEGKGLPGPQVDPRVTPEQVSRTLRDLIGPVPFEEPEPFSEPEWEEPRQQPRKRDERKESFMAWFERRYGKRNKARYLRRR